ncbi:hypothetical protein JCM1840_001060 [Sporobolomyces johnsonii]
MAPTPSKQAPKVNSERASRSPSPDFDPTAFQASLDESVSAVRALVDTWIPKDFAGGFASTSNGATGAAALQSLKEKARPPRLGLGAKPAALHKQQAEDRKMRDRLLGRGKKTALGDEGTVVKAISGAAGQDEASESEDEEDSRSRAVGKGKVKSNGLLPSTTNAPNNPFVLKKSTTSAGPSSATPQKSSAQPLFNSPSPTKPSPAPSTAASSSKPTKAAPAIAPVSFYTAIPSSSTDTLTPALSKNQRKKLRKQERELELKQQREAESRKEEELERKRAREDAGEADDQDGEPTSASPSPKKARLGPKPPFAPVDSPASMSVDGEEGPASPSPRDAEDEDGADEDDGPGVGKLPATNGSEGAVQAGGAAAAQKKKKKKKRKSKGGEGAPAPLLNLAPR